MSRLLILFYYFFPDHHIIPSNFCTDPHPKHEKSLLYKLSTFFNSRSLRLSFVISIINWVLTLLMNPDTYFLPSAEKTFQKYQKHVKRKYRLISIQSSVFGNFFTVTTFESYIRFSERFSDYSSILSFLFLWCKKVNFFNFHFLWLLPDLVKHFGRDWDHLVEPKEFLQTTCQIPWLPQGPPRNFSDSRLFFSRILWRFPDYFNPSSFFLISSTVAILFNLASYSHPGHCTDKS